MTNERAFPEIRDERLARLETWDGYAFLNFDEQAPSLADDLGNLPALLASHRMAALRCTWRFDIEARCNWKLLVENATEGRTWRNPRQPRARSRRRPR